MSDITINGAGNIGQGLPQIKSANKEPAAGFDEMMQEAMGKLSQVQSDSEQAVKELASGGDPTAAILAMEKADMNFQLMVEVRNKLISAYQAVMNMQV
jgi:flagellar hook-basal body complex protein FliE